MRIVPLLLATLSVLACAEARSQQPSHEIVLPGSELLDESRIRPHRVRYEKPGGFMRYEMEKIDRDGRALYRLRVFFNSETAPPDEMYFDAATLAYVGRRLETEDYVVDVGVDDNHLTGELTPKAGSKYTERAYDKTYPHGGFEPAVMNYWMTALPLTEGYKASIPIIDLANGLEMTWADIEVVGRETLEIDGETYDAWKVTSLNGRRKKTIWVSSSVPYALKMVTRGNRGAWVLKNVG